MPGVRKLSGYPLSFEVYFLCADGTLVEDADSQIEVVAGEIGTWILRLGVNVGRIEPGSAIIWRRRNIHMAHRLQNTHPMRRDYVSVECDGEGEIALESVAENAILLVVGEAGLAQGDEIRLYIGDRRSGGAGCDVFWSVTEGRFLLEIAPGEEAEAIQAAPDVTVHCVAHNEPDLLRLLGPTVVATGESFDMHLVIYDRNRNPVENFVGTVKFDIPEGLDGLPAEYTFCPEDAGAKVFESISAREEGVYRVAVSGSGLDALSNPMICEDEPAKRIYWGDLHAHGWGDCTMLLMRDNTGKMLPRERHRQARLYGRYDYGAPGPMSMPPGEERNGIWQEWVSAYEEYDAREGYVPFLSMEMHPFAPGDRQLIFKAEETIVPIDMREDAETVYGRYGSRDDAMLEVHIGGAAPYYELYKPREEKIVEVSSAFGNAEWLLQKALRYGFHPAITGASDLHLGLMGSPRALEPFRGRFGKRLNVRDCGFGSGPVGALVTNEQNRDELWRSLESRHGYATSGDRIYVRLEADGHRMGEIADIPALFELELEIYGEATIERVDLIVGEYLAESFYPDAPDVTLDLDFDRLEMPPGKWFYFRIRQANGEYAWTAPIWFADGEEMGNAEIEWPAWNAAEEPDEVRTPETEMQREALEAYLESEGDREIFAEMIPIGFETSTVGTCAKFVTTISPEEYPVTLRWYYGWEHPKLRVDWGYEAFGPVDCQVGPEEGE